MKVEYIARKVTLSEQSRQLAEKKLAKIKKYFNDIIDIRVEVRPDSSGNPPSDSQSLRFFKDHRFTVPKITN